MSFSGTPKSPPSINWFTGDGVALTTRDNNDAGEAQGDATRTLTTADDRRPFRCQATLGDVQQVCEVVVQVPREFLSCISNDNNNNNNNNNMLIYNAHKVKYARIVGAGSRHRWPDRVC